MPDLGWPTPVLSVWLARPGEPVYAGDRVVEVLLDGATVDLPAPCTGRLAEWLAWPADRLAPGQVVGTIEADEAEDDADS
jgi:pyruvate/2-oxoglutarate dehydrogenase complex dihydrolipoamide acyltransferase (E2) component